MDEATSTAQVSYTLPQHTTSLSAALTARVLLALPGTNGEPDYQQFDMRELLPGQASLQHRWGTCLRHSTQCTWQLSGVRDSMCVKVEHLSGIEFAWHQVKS